MIKLNFAKYKDKVKACWLGKNIGGTMGTPYEGTREYLDIKGFVTKKGEVLPNDDLDLQLVWLLALERAGAVNINASLLGEYWISYITPHWNEYGIGKANLKRGLGAPLCGDYMNNWCDSNGAWIRTEIWACAVPANPYAAVKYAMEDAKVDHGAGEGTFAAAFVAGMQSAAFVLDDIRKCIAVGLSFIPEESRVAKSVKFVMDAYDKGMTPREARDAVQQMNADIGDGWFEAPSNVAYVILGLLYGEGDFKKSMIAAINCGDDTDCTGATLGATLGILNGMAGIPEDWVEYLGDDIVTVSIARGCAGAYVPKTCTELTERTVRMAPAALFDNYQYKHNDYLDVELVYDSDDVIPENVFDKMLAAATAARVKIDRMKPYMLQFDGVCFTVDITLSGAPVIKAGGELGVNINVINKNHMHENSSYAVELRWWLPEGFSVVGDQNLFLYSWTRHSIEPHAETDVVIKAGDNVAATNRIVLEISVPGRHTAVYCPITLLG